MRKIKILEQMNEVNVSTLRRYHEQLDEWREQVEDFQQAQCETNAAICKTVVDERNTLIEVGAKINFLRKTTVGLVFIIAGLIVSSLVMRRDIQELRNMMNEG